ncbi:phytanoyl-CoA dioxygenase family protein [Fimbriimonas ginsengisoli]|uniref:Phytanoyl-CoA dioxygenase, putative n=1 Tax=Fimbriimonas ginsengisoli Gsoil 348 TaxID=661478 RepID=A0A068NR81_FIMGI|nr:phytanoyl-CoA dioxygenase family protein [Fimbriimonas ginsengisoli]AIE84079.1 phytanoyl-CoA dioxygenase, putative [Fimbriimonas ginsengisoli Gsoil 348]
MISDAQWQQFERDGYLNLGKLLSDEELAGLQKRIDEIMLGEASLDYGRLLMQLDSTTGEYKDAPEQSNGFKGATLAYRKIQNLEHDDLFSAYLRKPVFRDICARAYGPETPIACFRAMFMNKPSHQGTKLPWHQDAWTDLDRQPTITLWTALDPATKANGCVEAIPGSHRGGLINPEHNSGFLSQEQAAEICTPDKVVYLELKPGEVVLLHNWLLHSSDVNRTDVSRRGFSVCYMDANTVSKSGARFEPLFEAVAV